MSNRIKCAYCDWSTPRFTTTKKGEHRHGGRRLLDHVQEKHPDDYLRIRRAVDDYKAMEAEYETERF